MSTPANTGSYTIQNHRALAEYAKKFAPAVASVDEPAQTPFETDFFARLNMPQNVNLADSAHFTIEVQPDFRYIFYYIVYNVKKMYPTLDVRPNPNVSTLSLVGYCLDLVYAQLLLFDLHVRREKSFFALPFANDTMLNDYINAFAELRIPKFMEVLLNQLAPTLDPRRHNIEFVPTLAAFRFTHDYGRLIPGFILYKAHDFVASTRANIDPPVAVRRLYRTQLCSYNNVIFRIGNIFGTSYNDAQGNPVVHPNWLNTAFEAIFNPVIGRALARRPTFARIILEPYVENVALDFNPYIYALSATADNIGFITPFVGGISDVIKDVEPSSSTLGANIAKMSGITIMSHSIEPVTLPTWTPREIPDGDQPIDTVVNDRQYAQTHNYLVEPEDFDQRIPYPQDPATIRLGLYLVRDRPYDPRRSPLNYVLFDPRSHVRPDVLYFQPYDLAPSSLAFTVALGIKIEVAEIDGLTIPTENPNASLIENNSQIRQASLPVSRIRPILFDQDTAERIVDRVILDYVYQSIGLAFRNMARNVLAYFDNRNVNDPGNDITPAGYTREERHDNHLKSFTYTGFRTDEDPSFPADYVYLWSSYRWINTRRRPSPEQIYFYFSFRGVYGTNVTLSSTRNPVLLLPQ